MTNYELQYRGVDTPNDVDNTFYEAVTVSAGMNMSYDILGLVTHSTYNVSVRATNQYGVGDFSEEVTVRTEEGGECVLHCAVQEAAALLMTMHMLLLTECAHIQLEAF